MQMAHGKAEKHPCSDGSSCLDKPKRVSYNCNKKEKSRREKPKN
jgi:hypothetical protein